MRSFDPFTLRDFLMESNRIEGIRGVNGHLYAAAERFLAKEVLTRQDMIDFVSVAQPNAVIRDKEWLNVRVGNHVARRGGPEILTVLDGAGLIEKSGSTFKAVAALMEA